MDADAGNKMLLLIFIWFLSTTMEQSFLLYESIRFNTLGKYLAIKYNDSSMNPSMFMGRQ